MNFKNNVEKVKDFALRRLIEFIGIFILFFSVLILVALISYSPNDPNFIYPKNLNMKNIVKESGAGNLKAEQTIRNLEDRLARALAHVINILDPDSIVLGGGLSNIDRLYSNVPKIWAEYIFSDDVSTVLSKARFGDSSGVRGAAWL